MKKHLRIPFTVMFAIALQASIAQSPYLFKNIDINNIDAKISPSSDLFWDFSNSYFYVPKGGTTQPIFAGGLWIGGLDNGGNIHMAAQTYRQTGSDFWSGPVDTIHFGQGGPANYLNYNEPWKVSKAEIQNHILNYNTPNYIVPQNIADWPGYDTTVQRVLAPFADYNNNGIYDPQNGDYPYILGDQSVYAVFNDWYNHTESSCDYMGIEVHREFWGFDEPADTVLNNTIFSRYEIKNYENNDYHDVYITIWTDFDLGDAFDDFIGTDLNLNMVYVYNGDSIDGQPPVGYGTNPPAFGVYFLNQNLTSSMVYDNTNGVPNGNPGNCNDFLNYAKGIWIDNQPITYGGNGRNINSPVTNFMYPGNTDSVNFPTLGEWSESTAGNTPGDRRAIGSIGPFNLPSKSVITFDVGYTYARSTSGGPLASVTELQNAVSGLRTMYNNGLLTSEHTLPNTSFGEISVYPNPASELVTITNTSVEKLFNVTILDAMGRVVYNKDKITNGLLNVDVRFFNKGIYFISVMQDKKVINQKLIIK